MRSFGGIAGAITPRRLGFVAGIGCLLLSLAYLAALRPDLGTSSTDNRDNGATTNHESKLICDDSGNRTQVCEIIGDIRIHGASLTLFVASSQLQTNIKGESHKINPYPRKWDSAAMKRVTELSIKSTSSNELPKCSITHQVPAVVFSTGGFAGNIYHDFNDILIPLFLTSMEFHGNVQLLISDFRYWFIYLRYRSIIEDLSHYPVIRLGKNDVVYCFSLALVGLKSHSTLGIESSKSPNNYSMSDFKGFLRASYSLKREYATCLTSSKKLRLLVLSRKGSRSITNEGEMIAMARSLGYEVAVAGPKVTMDLVSFAGIVNSCDVMLGVSGAGLTNMVFLPSNATLMYIVPVGLKYISKADYGDPARAMGLRTIAYEISTEESTLAKKYPRDHEVFKDPAVFHQKHGWDALYDTFLVGQNVTLDVGRFKRVLQQGLQTPPAY